MLVAAAVVTTCSPPVVNRPRHPLYHAFSAVGKYYVGPKP